MSLSLPQLCLLLVVIILCKPHLQVHANDSNAETEEARIKRTGKTYVYQYNQHRGRCHDPKTPEYGFSFYHSTHVGAVVIHKCKSGYKLVGSKIRTCRQTGYWYPGIPKCVGSSYHKKSCNQPGTLENGFILVSTTHVNSIIKYKCNPGYHLAGSNYRVCRPNGVWTGTAPECIARGCQRLQNPENGNVQVTSTRIGAVATYSCNDGFTLVGNKNRVCRPNGQWSGGAPSCQEISCSTLANPQNGNVDFSYTTVGSTAQYSCNAGFFLVGDKTRTCQSNREWSGMAPVCRPLSCGQLNSPLNGKVIVSGTTPGSVATYSCNQGFTLMGQYKRTCQINGEWSGTEPKCNPIPCQDLEAPANGRIEFSSSSSSTQRPGDKATYSCSAGFNLVGGTRIRVCKQDGSYSGQAPSCKPVSCGNLRDPPNGQVDLTGIRVRDRATYSCNRGFVLQGVSVRTCQANGAWSGQEPLCQPVDCGSLFNPENGQVSITTTKLGGVAKYRCNDGFELFGTVVRRCLANGQWSRNAPTCRINSCGELDDPPNGRVRLTGTSVGSTAIYFCNEGFVLEGTSKRLCQNNAAWSGREPRCRRKTCESLENPENGRVTIVGGSGPGSVAQYSCNAGFELVGERRRVCSRNGLFSGSAPICRPIHCGQLENPANGRVEVNGRTPGAEASYTCNPGFTLIGQRVRVCQNNSTFSGQAPTCKPAICEEVPSIQNGQVTVSGTRPGAIAIYRCNSGFRLIGQRTRVCEIDGTFSGQAPTCQRIDCGPLNNIDNGRVEFSSTNVGSIANYFCKNGFSLVGEGQRTCQQSGQWSGVEPTCKIVDCGILTPPRNGDVIFTSTTFLSRASYSCKNGFKLVGSETRVCQANGQWSNTAPVCQPIDCETLSNPENGFVSVNGNTVGAIATYGCNPGFILVGRRVRVCRNDGQYSGVEPVCRATTCGELQDPVNGVVNFESTTVGSRATYTCNRGFVLSGVSTRVCQRTGEWSGTEPTCNIVSCGELRPIPNGDVTFASTGVGSIATYSCDFGFVLIGTETRTCRANGQWSGREPLCKPIECGSLDSPANGIVTVEGTTVGSVAKYSCNPGFSLIGTKVRTCQASGEWSGIAPTCQSIDCGSLPDPEFGTVTITGTSTGSLATYKCNKGFRLNGSSTRVCLNTGEWSQEAPTCEPEDCGPLDNPQNGKVDASGTAFWDTATYMCDPGYELIGESIRTCEENGQWSGTAPFCLSATCGLLSSPKNGLVSFTGVTIESEAMYSCFPGFILIGDEIRTCQKNGQWSGQEPHCRAVNCGPLNNPENGEVTVSSTDVFGMAIYTCNEGFGLIGVSSRICQVDGTWSDSPPTCEPTDCGQLVSPANGMVKTTGTKFWDTATYSCMPGFQLQGQESRTCSDSGSWTGEAPTCVVVDCGRLQSPFNGGVEFSTTTFRSEATYFCDKAFELIGVQTRFCQADGEWSGEAPTCQSISCTELTAPINGQIQLTHGNLAGSVAYYSCNRGFKLIGDKERKCQASGEWTGTEPTCQGLQCKVLDDIPNGIVSQTGTTVSSTATYTCNDGFELFGRKTRECLSSGIWSGIEPQCRPVGCGPLDHPLNGIVVLSGVSVGDTATYNCRNGFQLVGNGFRVCQASGQWSGEAPTCESSDCGPLTDPLNGEVTFDGTSVGSSATYTCNDGFILSGNQRRQCLRTGNWTGSDPICRIIDCGPLSAPSNGEVRVPSTTFGSNARYSCFTGFTLVGFSTRVCQLDGRWSGKAPVCEVVRCTILPKPANGIVTITGTIVGSKATYTCDRGFELIGENTRLCTNEGTWSGAEPTCKAISCGTLTAPINGEVSYTTSTVGSVAIYSCNSNLVLVGSSRRTCQENGQWGGTTPVCESKGTDCGPLNNPENGQVLLSGTKRGDSATYTCFVGFSLAGSDIRYCQDDGKWSGSAPRCNPMDCPRLTPPENGEIKYIGSGFGELVRYSCLPGFKIEGTVSRTCKSNGQWSGEAPTCEPESPTSPPSPLPGCGDPGVPANGKKIGESYKVGSIVYYECNTGFRLEGPKSRLCRFDGKWTDSLPSCVGSGQCVGNKKVEDDCGQLCSCENGYLTNCCRLRRDYASYSDEEKERYINAVTTVSSNPAYKSRYVALVEKYKSSFGTLAQNSIPANSQFFVWNRFFLIEYENLLREVDCRITMPYYDWTILHANPYIHPVYDDKTGFGKSARDSDRCVSTGPFSYDKFSLIDSAGGGCLKRDYTNRKFPSRALVERDVLTRPASEFSDFQRSLQLYIHTNVRCFIGGTMCTTDAANDPLFALHLTMLDYWFSRWQSFDEFRLKIRYSKDNSALSLAPEFTVSQFHDNSNLPNNLAVCYAEPRVKNRVPTGLYFLAQSFSEGSARQENLNIKCIAENQYANSGQQLTDEDKAYVQHQCSYGEGHK